MIAEGRVGAQVAVDGTVREVSLDRTGAQRVSFAHGEWYEAACRGNVFMGTTPAAGVVLGQSLGTTMAYALSNPRGSDVDLVVLAISVGYIWVTTTVYGAGTIVLAQYVENAANAAPIAGTAVVPQCSRLGLHKPRGQAFSAATLSAAPTIMFPLFDIGAKVETSALAPVPYVVPAHGAIVIPPGTAIAIGAIAAAPTNTPLGIIGCIWEEVARAA